LEHILGQEWEIVPAGGATGEAFYASYNDQRLFLKRNSSPFLAVLSAEGIVPKLVWTKRLENGDVITAQQWLPGRELKPRDMTHENVARMLRKIHRSEPMVGMLSRLEKQPLKPEATKKCYRYLL
jgi:thiamine kinase-like enzyme